MPVQKHREHASARRQPVVSRRRIRSLRGIEVKSAPPGCDRIWPAAQSDDLIDID